jgi:hypothetical protein
LYVKIKVIVIWYYYVYFRMMDPETLSLLPPTHRTYPTGEAYHPQIYLSTHQSLFGD